MAVAARNRSPRYYWDWGRRVSDLPYRKFCGTAPQNLLMGLEVALGLLGQRFAGADHLAARADRPTPRPRRFANAVLTAP